MRHVKMKETTVGKLNVRSDMLKDKHINVMETSFGERGKKKKNNKNTCTHFQMNKLFMQEIFKRRLKGDGI